MRRHLLILGATGYTGRHLVRQALDAGHSVTAVSRHPEQLTREHPHLATRALDLTRDEDALAQLLRGHDVVLSTVGRGLKLRAHGLIAKADPLILRAMPRADLASATRQDMTVSGGSLGDVRPETTSPSPG